MATNSLVKPLSSQSAAEQAGLSALKTDEHGAFETEVVGFFVDAAEILGVPRSVAAIYGVIFASPIPLSFSDIELRVSFSKGSVSQGLRVLRDVGALKEASSDVSSRTPNSDLSAKVPLSGTKAELPSPSRAKGRDRYEPDMELRNLIKHFLETRLQSQLDSGSGRLARIESAIQNLNSEDSEVLRVRTKYLASWHQKAHAMLPIIRTAMMLVPKK